MPFAARLIPPLFFSLVTLATASAFAQQALPPEVDAALARAKLPREAVTMLVADADGVRPPRLAVMRATPKASGNVKSAAHASPFQRWRCAMCPNSCARTTRTWSFVNGFLSSVSQTTTRSVGPRPTENAFAWVVRSLTFSTSTGVSMPSARSSVRTS